MPELTDQTQDAAEMCRGRNWATEDPLGLGGLLIDAHRIGQLQTLSAAQSAAMLERFLADAGAGLRQFAARYPLRGAADSRLAFRELGLSIGLHALEALRARGERKSSAIRPVTLAHCANHSRPDYPVCPSRSCSGHSRS